MVNTAAIGRRHELEFIKILEKAGFHVMFRSVRVRFQAIDFDNLFDIVAVDSLKRKWYVSVKTGDHGYSKAHRKELMDWVETRSKPDDFVILAVKHKKDRGTSPEFEWIDDARWQVIRFALPTHDVI